MKALISSDELVSQLSNESIVVLDSRFYLLDHEKGRQLYIESHIPNARFVDLHTQLAATETEETGRHPLPSLEVFLTTMQSLGITKDSTVVVYDDMGGAIASRCWWMLTQLGICSYVLDGGFPEWNRLGLPTEFGIGSEILATEKMMLNQTDFALSVDENEVINNFELNQFCLLDARAAERFNGEEESMDPVAGHIPGAKNRPFSNNLEKSGLFKSASILREEFEALNQEDKPFVHYCGSGVTACHNVLASTIAGIDSKRVFVGSWSLWSKRMMRLVRESQED
ncbi:sulfurtransferase [Marinomonas sp. 15G1-11]|uniref:Sulfurtransferase n=1 Tax=Marinomonas phaeophyticola TaxID=3004091 RepID=A0ABT4JYF2_9GAMM|nr:sulfurtransferase [Marinomonas sp. 15G1-11]MCZ2723255.1 sulfurtransferase [Marinomonas sp. 15G1-11]